MVSVTKAEPDPTYPDCKNLIKQECSHDYDGRRSSSRRSAQGHYPLAFYHQPQGHRYAVSMVLVHYVPDWRRYGARNPGGAIPAGLAGGRSTFLQPDGYGACPDHDFWRGNAWLRGFCQLDDTDDDRCARYGATETEQLEFLVVAVCDLSTDSFIVRTGWGTGSGVDNLSTAFSSGWNGR